MELELVRECAYTDAQHWPDEPCTHRGLIKVSRSDNTVRWLVDPEAGDGHPHFIAGMLEDHDEPGIVDTNALAFYAALAVMDL